MLNNLNAKHKNFLKFFILVLMFIYNVVFTSCTFLLYTVGQLVAYLIDDFTFDRSVLFSSAEFWVWFVLITTVLLLGLFIAYIVLSIKSIKNNGLTKKLCIKCLVFTILYTAFYSAPIILDELFF